MHQGAGAWGLDGVRDQDTVRIPECRMVGE